MTFPGVICSCGAIIFAPAPEVHAFIAGHAPGNIRNHYFRTVFPGQPLAENLAPAYDQLTALASEHTRPDQ
jgi:hypothetical protein